MVKENRKDLTPALVAVERNIKNAVGWSVEKPDIRITFLAGVSDACGWCQLHL
jgi:hypothetical protein